MAGIGVRPLAWVASSRQRPPGVKLRARPARLIVAIVAIGGRDKRGLAASRSITAVADGQTRGRGRETPERRGLAAAQQNVIGGLCVRGQGRGDRREAHRRDGIAERAGRGLHGRDGDPGVVGDAGRGGQSLGVDQQEPVGDFDARDLAGEPQRVGRGRRGGVGEQELVRWNDVGGDDVGRLQLARGVEFEHLRRSRPDRACSAPACPGAGRPGPLRRPRAAPPASPWRRAQAAGGSPEAGPDGSRSPAGSPCRDTIRWRSARCRR